MKAKRIPVRNHVCETGDVLATNSFNNVFVCLFTDASEVALRTFPATFAECRITVSCPRNVRRIVAVVFIRSN